MRATCKLVIIVSLFLVAFFVCVVVNMFYLTSQDPVTEDISLESFNSLANKKDFVQHVEDMRRLQKSINSELSQLELKRKKLKENITAMEGKSTTMGKSLAEMESSIRQIKVDIQNMILKREETLKDYPPAYLPLQLLPEKQRGKPTVAVNSEICDMTLCFDFSRCSIFTKFSVYLYPIISDNPLVTAWKSSLLNSQYIVDNPDHACLYIVIMESNTDEATLSLLPHWYGGGSNHVLITLDESQSKISNSHAIVAHTNLDLVDNYRKDFDLLLPMIETTSIQPQNLPLLLPVRRKYLASFTGSLPSTSAQKESEPFIQAFAKLNLPDFGVYIATTCELTENCDTSTWCLCKDYSNLSLELSSTFTLIPNTAGMSYRQLTFRLMKALKCGSVPVIIGNFYDLPLSDILQWKTVAVMIPRQRITELVYMLRNILEPDIMQYKQKGRALFEMNLSSVACLSDTLLTSLRERIGVPPSPPPTVKSQPIYNNHNLMPTFEAKVEPGQETLGPIEDPFPSPSYQRNFTSWILDYSTNTYSIRSVLYPHTPWDPILPTDAKFHGSPYGFRPINNGMGGSGKEFSLSLGGNHPVEQFTIVVLTYDRPDLLQMQLAQFNGIPFLNKVLVIWNNPKPPDPMLKWPKIHVPIQVIKAKRNSLNNRFIPYDEIETEAILSMDDDMYLRDFEIVFAFRVWRESRDRIVGFPGRYHAWNPIDQAWNYNSNHSCELSMILTGAAFFHKYYAYQYTYTMSQVIRDKVDEFMNCEDIAMNFLVSHITGKPPIKTTSRWTFRCPTCGESALWIDESHFKERHQCVNFFIRVYGYLPLKYTQFRADSVLFKTRVPQDKNKCFATV